MGWVVGLLPAAILIGIIVPELVEVAPAEEQQSQPAETRATYTAPPLRKSPLLVPRDFTAGFRQELFDLTDLFSRAPYAPTDAELSRMVAFPQNSGELIALDEASEQLKDVSFKDVLAAAVVPTSELPGIPPFLPLINPIPRSDGLRYDDFTGPGNGAEELTTPIPEPGTGLLVAAGLLLLAGARSRI